MNSVPSDVLNKACEAMNKILAYDGVRGELTHIGLENGIDVMVYLIMEERERCVNIASDIGSDLRNPDRARITAAKIADAIRGPSS
jgi:hypothetical protein